MKEKLRVWKREVFGDLSKSKAEIVRKIEKLDLKESTEGLARELREERCMMRVRLEELVFKEQIIFALMHLSYV